MSPPPGFGTSRRASAAVLLLLAALPAGSLSLKLGSVVPRGSPWELALKKVAGEWSAISSGEVDLKLYSGGIAGGEADIVRKIRIGQLQAALLTMSGLQTIWNGVKVLSFPLFVRTEAEFLHVFEAMKPTFERELEARGFKVVLWTTGGWIYFFTRLPVVRADDLRRQRLYVSGDPDEVQAWHETGFQVVPLATNEIMTSLQGGLIDGMATSPLVAASNQWFAIASHMCGLKLSPLYGAVVVSTRSWEQIAERLRPRLLAAAQAVERELAPTITRSDAEAIAVMQRYGLQIHDVPADARREWEQIVQRGFAMLAGTAYDAASLAEQQAALEAFRASGVGR